MFSLLSLSKSKFFVALVSHLCQSCLTRVTFVLHSCRTLVWKYTRSESRCSTRKSRHVKNYIYGEASSSWSAWQMLLLLKSSDIWSATLCKRIFFSFLSSKLKSTLRNFNLKEFLEVKECLLYKTALMFTSVFVFCLQWPRTFLFCFVC